MTNADLIIMDSILNARVRSYLSDMTRIRSLSALRASGHAYTIDDYVEGMVRAILANSVPWSRIAPHFTSGTIKRIFHNYSAATLLVVPYMTLVTDLRAIRCGNRSDVSQMRALANNIRILQRIIVVYGSIEAYLRPKCPSYPKIPLSALSDFKTGKVYKLGGMGIPLVCEFFKNMGFLIPKPDVHLKRFLGNDRMGASLRGQANDGEVFSQVDTLASGGRFTIPEIDLIIWSFCAKKYGEICAKIPNCSSCPFHRLRGGPCHHP